MKAFNWYSRIIIALGTVACLFLLPRLTLGVIIIALVIRLIIRIKREVNN